MGNDTSQHIIRASADTLWWHAPGSGREPRQLDCEATRRELRDAVSQPRASLIFAAPGIDVRLVTLAVAPEEKKHLRKLLPFRLEEHVAHDVADIHFALRMLDGGKEAAVALCSHERMQHWRVLLEGLPVERWVPEPLLLPWQSGEWSLVVEPGQVLVRTGRYTGLAIESEHLGMLLAALLEEAQQPDTVVVYGMEQSADLALLPQTLREQAQWRRGDFSSALMLGGDDGAAPGLLQGEYAPRLPLRQWWRDWRAVAAALVALTTLHFGTTFAEVAQLERKNTALRQAVQEAYRSVNPRGALVDPEKQLGNELTRLRGNGESAGFVSLFDKVAAALSGSADVRIASVNYNQSAGQMRLNLIADGFQSVEAVRGALVDAGLQATMESSSARDAGVRARLMVGS